MRELTPDELADLSLDGTPVLTGDAYGIDLTPADAQNGIWEAQPIPPKPALTPEQLAWLAYKAQQRASRTPKGKLAALLSAASRLTNRVPTERELERQARKAFKKQQKRMELLTKKKYPTPKKRASRRVF